MSIRSAKWMAVGLALIVAAPTAAAGTSWTRVIPPASAFGVAADASGITVVGSTDAALHGPNRGGHDAFIRRYDHQGKVLWGRQLGTADTEVKNDSAYDVDAGASSIAVIGVLANRPFVRRYRLDGQLLWGVWAPVGHSFLDVAISTSGVYVAGQARDADDLPNDVFIRRYRLDGTIAWTRYVRGPEDEAERDVAVDLEGVTLLWSPQRGLDVPAPRWDTAIRRYDLAGDELWTRTSGTGTPTEFSTALAADEAGLTVVGGMARPRPGEQQGDSFIRRYNHGGTLLWAQTFGGSHGAIARGVDADGSGISVAGELFGPTIEDSHTWFVRRYSRFGAPQWTKRLPTEPYRAIVGIAIGGGADIVAGDYRVDASDWDAFVSRYAR